MTDAAQHAQSTSAKASLGGDSLLALTIASCGGLELDDGEAAWVAVALRLGLDLGSPDSCRCGASRRRRWRRPGPRLPASTRRNCQASRGHRAFAGVDRSATVQGPARPHTPGWKKTLRDDADSAAGSRPRVGPHCAQHLRGLRG